MEFLQGQRVKLTSAAAMVKQRGIIKQNDRKIDWMSRQGTVAHRTMPGSSGVLIRWDGASYPDQWPKSAVELVER
jgi:hypothetical protein